MTTASQPIRAVVFDLDGLMFNTEALYHQVGSEILRRRGKSFDDDLLDQMMGRPGAIALQIMIDWHSLDASVAELSRETDEVFATLLDHSLETMAGLMPLLETLERVGLPKAIATSSGRAFATNVLGRFELQPRFQFVLTAEDIEHGKPHPEIYLRAAQRLGVGPAEMMVLEDSANGCRAAVAAGAFAVAVPGGHSLRHDFSGCRLVADSLADPEIVAALAIA